jgi:hypothetical protein
MINVTSSGSFNNVERFLKNMLRRNFGPDLHRYGQRGVDALARVTPYDTGLTSRSWDYRIIDTGGQIGITWFNTNTPNGAPIAVMLQYGHGTGTGGWVAGYDYINPAMRPIFDEIAEEIWKKVKNG